MASKNQKSGKPTGPYTEPGDTKRFIPLGDNHCYLRDPRNGNTHHLKIDSPAFYEKLSEITEKYPVEKIKAEISSLSARYPNDLWSKVLPKL